jgi:beta-phosphoglucomutase-like phosphatase (HAD superfamily)
MGIRAVIFDFNGVLVDDESVHFELFREVLAQEGVMMSERDYHERYLGYDDRRCFAAALEDAGQSPNADQIERLIAIKGRRYIEVADRGLRFFPGAAETLRAVAARWPIAICSGALRSEIEYGLRRLDRSDQVTVIISAENTDRCKPDPEGYRLALAALRSHALPRQKRHEASSICEKPLLELEPADCLVVEDSLAGIMAAIRAGMRAVGISNTYTAASLRQAGADEVVDGLATLTPEWIGLRFAS